MHEFWARLRGRAIAAATIVAVAVPLVGSTSPALAAPTFTVNSTADTLTGTNCTTPTGTCTLRAAVAAANATTGATINLPAGTFRLNLTSGTDVGDLDLKKPMTINGARSTPGVAATTIDADQRDRAFEVQSAGVTITGVVVTNGKATTTSGGAINVNRNAALTLADSTVAGNTTGKDGAGIYNNGTLTVDRSTLSGNTATAKGGGVQNDATLTVRNSTIHGNTAKGGGGISNSGTATLSFSTVTANNSNNSNGGGVYQPGGKISIGGSILAYNNATSSGRDCYGTPDWTGPNIVQTLAGCNPSGLVLTVDPQLGALGDYGGPTYTRLPDPGSPAIDVQATPCAVDVDQRGVARPVGAKCDLGSVEVAPLSVDATLTATPAEIGVGLGTIPAENIPPELLIAAEDESATEASALTRYALTRYALTRYPIEGTAVGDMTLGETALTRYALTRYALTRYALTRYPLSDIPVDGGWDAILAPEFAPDPVPPLQTLTLADIAAFGSVQALTLDQLDLGSSPYGSLPVVDFAFEGYELERIPPTDDPDSPLQDPDPSLDDDRLAAWCELLGDAGCAAAGVDDDPTDGTAPDPEVSEATMLGVSLTSTSLDSTALTRYALTRYALTRYALTRYATYNSALTRYEVEDFALTRYALTRYDLDAIDIDPSALTRYSLGDTALTRYGDSLQYLVDCSQPLVFVCSTPGATLNDAQAAGVLIGSVGDLVEAILNEEIAELLNLTFIDLFPGLFADTGFLPWETLNLATTSLQNAASPLEAPATFTAGITIGGGTPAGLAIDLTLPPGFLYVPGSAKFDGATIGDPAEQSGTLHFTQTSVPLGAHTLTVEARAGLVLGDATATVDVTATTAQESRSDSAEATIRVKESFELDDTPEDTRELRDGVLYVAHLDSADDEDVYTFQVTEPGTRLRLLLSNMDVDYDLVLQGPPQPPLRGEPQQEERGVEDFGIDLDPRTDTAAPDVQYDVWVDTALGDPVSIAADRDLAPEAIETGVLPLGTYHAVVQGYNGAFSAQPYLLQVLATVENLPVCPAREFSFGAQVGGLDARWRSLPAAGNAPADANTLVLVAPSRMTSMFGLDRTQGVLDRLDALAVEAAAGVSGVVVPVDADPAVDAAFDAWDANRCEPALANDVAREIATIVDEYRAARPGIEHVVLVGEDGQIPSFRIRDKVEVAPEVTYTEEFESGNAIAAAFARNMYPSDVPYGASRGVQVNGGEFFVPEVAVGRLAETPEDAVKALQNFLDYDGNLDATTAASALVTGYEFLADGAEQVAQGLEGNGATVDRLINEEWTADDLQAALGADPDVASVNSHFDHANALPADQNAARTADDLFDVGDLPAGGDRKVYFSMGCHSGLSVSDIELGVAEPDWVQAMAGRGTTWLGNTTYGYGDTEKVAFSELLDQYFAEQFGTGVSVGRAWVLAAQQYRAGIAKVSPYDEKILQAFNVYGLPMWKVAGDEPAPPVAPLVAALAEAAPEPLTIDPVTGLGTAPIAFDLPVGDGAGQLHEVTADDGSYFEVDGNTLDVQYRPRQPLTSADVSRRDEAGALTETAHGVLFTDVTSTDVEDFTPQYVYPDPTAGASGGLGGPVGDAAFPSSPLELNTYLAPEGGQRQRLLFVPGQFRPDPDTPGLGTQRLFTGAEGVVLYTDPAVTDFTPPTIFESRGAVIEQTVGFAVETDDTARRTYVLFRERGTQDWRGVDLVAQGAEPGVLRWTGGALVSGATDVIEFAIQVFDEHGNGSWSNDKTENFEAVRVAQGTLEVTTSAAQPPVNGWFVTSPVTVAISGAPEGATIFYSLDGAAYAEYTGPFTVTGEGVHFVEAIDDAGNEGAGVAPIDTRGPNVYAAVDAPGAVDGWTPGAVTVTITGIDPGGSGVAQLVWSATGAFTRPETTVAGESTQVVVPADGTTTLTFAAIDTAGNRGPNGTVTVKVDTTGPVVACGSADEQWHATDVTIACTASDAGVGLANAADASFGLSTSVPAGTETGAASTDSREVCDRLTHCTTAGPITANWVDKKAPTATITAPTASSFELGAVVLADYACSDGGSGIASCTATVDGDPVADGAPVPTTAGSHTMVVTAVDNVGRQATASVTYSTRYRVCLMYDPNQAQPRTGTVVVKVRLCDAAGTNLSSNAITLTAVSIDGGDPPPPNFQGNSNYGNRFRYDASNRQYVYNLDASKLAGITVGSHYMDFTASTTGATKYLAPFTLK